MLSTLFLVSCVEVRHRRAPVTQQSPQYMPSPDQYPRTTSLYFNGSSNIKPVNKDAPPNKFPFFVAKPKKLR